MKKIIALTLVLVMGLSLLACTKTPAATEPSTEPSTEPVVTGPATALEALEAIWAQYGEDEKFMSMGGSAAAPVDGAPGAVETTDTDTLQFTLHVPEDQNANIVSAASLLFAMNANSFTMAAYNVSGDATAFANAMRDGVQGTQWMCGFPEQLVISVIGNTVVVTYGVADFMNVYTAKIAAAYPDAVTVVNEPIA